MRNPYETPSTGYRITPTTDGLTLPVISTIYVGNDGDVTVMPAINSYSNDVIDPITFENITAPYILPVKVSKVYAGTLLTTEAGSALITETGNLQFAGTGRTTASGIIGLY